MLRIQHNVHSKRVRKNCFGVFSLQTGIMLIIFFDFFFFALLICQFGLGYEETQAMEDRSSGAKVNVTTSYGLFQINLFNILTDGLCILLQGIKTYYGFKYMQNVSFPSKIEYQYLDDGFGKFQWHTKRVKKMRHIFKNYFLASVVAYIFIFLQTIILLMIFWDQTVIYFRYIILLIVCCFQFLAMYKLTQHLEELDLQVNYRIQKFKHVSQSHKQDYQAPSLGFGSQRTMMNQEALNQSQKMD